MPSFAANLTMLFQEHDFLDRFRAAAEAGFGAVEYLFPYDFAKEELAARLKDHSLTQVLHNLPAGDWGAGERGIAILPDRVEEFRSGVGRAIDYATALGCPQVNCLAGIAPEGVDPERLYDTFVENLRYAAEALEGAGIRLLIEAINTKDIPGFFLNGTAQALHVLEAVGSPNLLLQYDVYHMHIMGEDVAPTIERTLDRIAHIQIADVPGRHEPGSGEIDYAHLFEFLDQVGYKGWVGCEYVPASTTHEGLGWFGPFARSTAAA